ncbi:MAG: flagellar biosynthesis protein FlhF [Treponema sp.]|nr:flagellar biosynthesis protein FlhF [Treponema sp.]
MGLEILVARGASRGDCVDKIVKRYGIYFNILREKTVASRGLFGLFPREEVEIEFYLSPQLGLQSAVSGVAQSHSGSGMDHQTLPIAMSAHHRNRPLPQVPSANLPGHGTTLDFEEAKKKVLAAAKRDPEKVIREVRQQEDWESDQQTILDKLKLIEEKLESGAGQKKENPTLVRMAEMLRQNDFSEEYTLDLMERARKELPLETLESLDLVQERFLEWIGESIKVYPTSQKPPRKTGEDHPARIVVLVGPTGVGKTTTIAKLAANYGLDKVSGHLIRSVQMITIDKFRLGAEHQIDKYANIMGIPVSFPDNFRELQRDIDLHREVADLILVDSIGRSPKDMKGLGEMKQFLDACGPKAEMHLVLTAGTKTGDLLHIMQQFEPFNYRAVLLSKLDETRHVGNVISALAEKNKPVSYIANGQTPWDIKKANVVQFLINLEEFRVDREAIQRRFPAEQADQF